jgi:hypothetical protein
MARIKRPADCTTGLPAVAFFKAKARRSKCLGSDCRRVQLRFIAVFFSVFPSSQICSAQLFEGCVAGFDDTSRAYDSSPLFLFSTCGAIICGVLRCRKGAGRALHSDQIAPAFITKSCEIQ